MYRTSLDIRHCKYLQLSFLQQHCVTFLLCLFLSHAAVSYNHLDLTQFLVQAGADINIRDPEGDTPLLVCESPEMFMLLARLGADVNATNTSGEGLFEKAIDDENFVLLQYLIENNHVSADKAAMAMDCKCLI